MDITRNMTISRRKADLRGKLIRGSMQLTLRVSAEARPSFEGMMFEVRVVA